MTVLRALATVVGTAFGFGAVGLAIGCLLGKFAPSFLRQTFTIRDPEHFDALEIGFASGLINGLIWGMVIGIMTVGIVAWKETRVTHARNAGSPTSPS